MIAANAGSSRQLRDRLLVASLLNAGRAADVVRLFESQGASAGDGALDVAMAVALARQDQGARAIDVLNRVPSTAPARADAERLLVNLLHVEAIRKTNAKASVEAAALVCEALKVDPRNGPLLALLGRLENAIPVAHLQAGRRAEAVSVWENAHRADPSNGRIAHSLALACRFWAESIDETNPDEAAALWRKAIAKWAQVAVSDRFWSEWARYRSVVYPFAHSAIDKARSFWASELTQLFQRKADEAREAGRDAQRFVRLHLEYWIELQTAAVLRDLARVSCRTCGEMVVPAGRPSEWVCGRAECSQPLGGGPAHDLPHLGPLALDSFGVLESAALLTSSGSLLPNGASLSGRFSELGLPFIKTNGEALAFLFSEGIALGSIANGRYPEALTLLADKTGRISGTLRLYASLEKGKQVLSSAPTLPAAPDTEAEERFLTPRKQVLAEWATALRDREHDPTLANDLLRRVEALAVGLANETLAASKPFSRDKNWNREIALLSSAIELLRSARGVANSERITLTLVGLYRERAMSYRMLANDAPTQQKEQGYRVAIADWEEALRLAPSDAELKSKAADEYNSVGCLKNNSRCISDFSRAIELDPTNPLYKANRGISYLDTDDHDQAIEDLAAACKVQRRPEWVKMAAAAFNRKGIKAWESYMSSARLGVPFDWEKQQALESFRTATELDPSNNTFKQNYQTANRTASATRRR